MFSKILIANRGEIALRIIRACREMGVQTAVVYSTADKDAAYLKLADQAICIGDAPPAESYLNIPRIISAAEIADVQAIHPGYGFLAENDHFAEICRSCRIEFIGPPTKAMALLGDKVECKKLAKESPSPVLKQDVREKLCDAAVRLIKAARYANAGTVEYLVDRKQNFYILEVNARIQVEHPVTEEVTGVDLIKEQIRIASGEPLGFKQKDVRQDGHAIECRINAEDPARNFAPSPGMIAEWRAPGGPGVRLDSHAYAGYRIPPNYDSMIGKLIVHRPTRGEAIAAMKRALSEFHIAPIKTTIPLHLQIMDNHDFQSGDVDTGFVERVLLGR